jgi:hypothetical protein
MTNEEFVEEIYHEAFEEGFIDQLNTALSTLHYTHPKLNRYERVEKAYYTIKKNMQSQINTVD